VSAPPDRQHLPALDPPADQPDTGRLRRFVTAALFTLLAAVVTIPDQLFELDRRSPFTQLVSFRPLILVVGAVLLVLLLVVLWFRHRAWPFVAGLTAVLIAGGALVLPRAVADPLPTSGTPLTVLSFNTYLGHADVRALADLIRAERPDVIALPEAGEDFTARLAPLVKPLGYRLYPTRGSDGSDAANVVAGVAADMGAVKVRVSATSSPEPFIEMTGGRLGSLRLAAIHTSAPRPGEVAQWHADLAGLREWCAGPTPAIVAGDFNATLDHSAMRKGMAGCADAAAQRGEGLIPTWGPGRRTRMLGPQIDHVLSTRGIEAETFSVHDLPGSDHRAIVTRLRIPT
jgi:endonuclease/exonuclease/phosphatase (EEP) superfamily protein YafD